MMIIAAPEKRLTRQNGLPERDWRPQFYGLYPITQASNSSDIFACSMH